MHPQRILLPIISFFPATSSLSGVFVQASATIYPLKWNLWLQPLTSQGEKEKKMPLEHPPFRKQVQKSTVCSCKDQKPDSQGLNPPEWSTATATRSISVTTRQHFTASLVHFRVSPTTPSTQGLHPPLAPSPFTLPCAACACACLRSVMLLLKEFLY